MVDYHQLIPENFNSKPSGQLNPLFLFPDNVQLNEIPACSPLSQSERDRLVKASKSPTADEKLEEGFKKAQFLHKLNVAKHCEPSPMCAVMKEEEQARTLTPVNAVGCKTIIEFRDWQEAWRVRTQAECISGMAPPAQAGSRESVMLTERGASKIAESCEFMYLKHDGFKTFVTGIFSTETRNKLWRLTYEFMGEGETLEGVVFSKIKWVPETTIQREVTRTMDALLKMFQRGWTTEKRNSRARP